MYMNDYIVSGLALANLRHHSNWSNGNDIVTLPSADGDPAFDNVTGRLAGSCSSAAA